MSLFKKTNEEKIQRFVNRLKNKEEGAISDIQREIQDLRKEEKVCQARIVEIEDLYEKYIHLIESHQGEWFKLDDLLVKAVEIMGAEFGPEVDKNGEPI